MTPGTRPLPGLSLTTDPAFREIAGPLFDAGLVGAVEWTVDLGFSERVAGWAERILSFYGDRGRLYAHGFALSPLSGEWRPRQERWLASLAEDVRRRAYRHVSEHFCFSFAGDFANAGPLPVPMTESTLALGRARLARLAEVAQKPIGLENLATSLCRRDALEQGTFLDRLLAPVDGFVVLDVHNLYCQIENFDLSADRLLESYPLDRVREIHVSGGCWETTQIVPNAPIRRDTHDDAVPGPVFELLAMALERCRNVEAVFLERLPGTLRTVVDAERFQRDYARMVEVVAHA